MNLKHQISSNWLLAVSIGFVFLWFGILKFFPSISPAENIAKKTIDLLTFNLIPSSTSIIILAIWESLIGVLLILNLHRRIAIIIALVHMLFTFLPLFFFTSECFKVTPFQLTLLGQYILKNIILISALLTLYNTNKITNLDKTVVY
jgi:uncharacterized membrane protein YphA (DoxX/SURF4 family)